jgi:hypothetical protein
VRVSDDKKKKFLVGMVMDRNIYWMYPTFMMSCRACIISSISVSALKW